MKGAEQIIAEALGDKIMHTNGSGDRNRACAAHVVAALREAGMEIVQPKALDRAIWRLLGDECDNANEPNCEEDNYDAGFIAGLTHAQKTFRAELPALLAAARVANGGDQP